MKHDASLLSHSQGQHVYGAHSNSLPLDNSPLLLEENNQIGYEEPTYNNNSYRQNLSVDEDKEMDLSLKSDPKSLKTHACSKVGSFTWMGASIGAVITGLVGGTDFGASILIGAVVGTIVGGIVVCCSDFDIVSWLSDMYREHPYIMIFAGLIVGGMLIAGPVGMICGTVAALTGIAGAMAAGAGYGLLAGAATGVLGATFLCLHDNFHGGRAKRGARHLVNKGIKQTLSDNNFIETQKNLKNAILNIELYNNGFTDKDLLEDIREDMKKVNAGFIQLKKNFNKNLSQIENLKKKDADNDEKKKDENKDITIRNFIKTHKKLQHDFNTATDFLDRQKNKDNHKLNEVQSQQRDPAEKEDHIQKLAAHVKNIQEKPALKSADFWEKVDLGGDIDGSGINIYKYTLANILYVEDKKTKKGSYYILERPTHKQISAEKIKINKCEPHKITNQETEVQTVLSLQDEAGGWWLKCYEGDPNFKYDRSLKKFYSSY